MDMQTLQVIAILGLAVGVFQAWSLWKMRISKEKAARMAELERKQRARIETEFDDFFVESLGITGLPSRHIHEVWLYHKAAKSIGATRRFVEVKRTQYSIELEQKERQ